ncbi:MAG: hypothetical protein HQM09_04880 [Candidatus Riflebacteria bacterium]|nr:hypothetical protein [Candidatus Riflebacteria bacterium]
MNRRGISIYIVLCCLLVVSILAFSSHFMALESLRKFRRVTDSYNSYLLARSAISCAVGRIQEGLESPTSAIFKTMLAENLATGTVINIDSTPLSRLTDAVKDSSVSVTARIESISPLDSVNLGLKTGGYDPAERVCSLLIEAYAVAGPAESHLKEAREFRIVHLMPGILGKFTIFVKDVGRDAYGYNRYGNNINGWPDDRVPPADRILPIVFKNGGELDEGSQEKEDPESYRKRGYIFLGGGPLVLNLTGGNDEMYGENFHFYNLSMTPSIPGYFDSCPPPYFTHPPDYSIRHPQSLNKGAPFDSSFAYILKYVVQGFFTSDADNQNMNLDDRLAVDLPGPSNVFNPKMCSSILHLFGPRSNPSPTLVIGDVRRRFAEYSGVLIEATGNDVRDAVLTYIRQTNKTIAQLPSIPSSVMPSNVGDIPPETPIAIDSNEVTYKTLFGDDGVYKSKMCRLVDEPYLRSHDFLYFRPEEVYEPTKSIFGESTSGDGGSASIQRTFTLPFNQSMNRTKPFFDGGKLEDLPDDFLVSKAVYRVPDIQTFLNRFQKDGKLFLDSVVSIIGSQKETSEFPVKTVIEKAGIMILENGNWRISGLQKGVDPDQIPVFVALNGNIELDLSQGSTMKAIFVALRGKIINLTPSRGLDLLGGLAVRNFPPETFPAGGRIDYGTQADPSGSLWGIYYRGFISDFATRVERN